MQVKKSATELRCVLQRLKHHRLENFNSLIIHLPVAVPICIFHCERDLSRSNTLSTSFLKNFLVTPTTTRLTDESTFDLDLHVQTDGGY